MAAAHPAAAQAAYDALRAGGSPADAAVAVQMTLGLVEPQSSGLGGGAFVLHWDASERALTTFDGRETAPAAADPGYWLGLPERSRPEHGASHFVVVDRHGDLVSATTTSEASFGSRVMTNGFLLNNQPTDFSFEPEEEGRPVANRVEGGQRPRSSMAPTIVFRDGEPALLIGSPGGSRIINHVAGALVGILDFGLEPQEAIDRPHVVNRNGVTEVEEGPGAQARIDVLAALGHEAEAADLNSGLHAILIEDGALRGAADKRREGAVLGA